jgi:ABC-type antimicrobial peptide transport system permease subunit
MMAIIGASEVGLIPNLLGALGIVLLITTALAIANTTVISVRERRSELASLRVLGFKKRSVALMIINEMFIVCLTGGALGTALAWFLMRDGISLGNKMMQSVTTTPSGLVAGLATSIVVPLIGSIVSSWLAVRAPLAEALRDAV